MGGSFKRTEQQLQKIILPILHSNPKISLLILLLSLTHKILHKHKLPLNNPINPTTAISIHRIQIFMPQHNPDNKQQHKDGFENKNERK